jgi:hypothetical protein
MVKGTGSDMEDRYVAVAGVCEKTAVAMCGPGPNAAMEPVAVYVTVPFGARGPTGWGLTVGQGMPSTKKVTALLALSAAVGVTVAVMVIVPPAGTVGAVRGEAGVVVTTRVVVVAGKPEGIMVMGLVAPLVPR